jgi:hypothetical protein
MVTRFLPAILLSYISSSALLSRESTVSWGCAMVAPMEAVTFKTWVPKVKARLRNRGSKFFCKSERSFFVYMPHDRNKLLSPHVTNTSGRIGMDFLSRYEIKIDTRRHSVTFQEIPPMAEMPGGHDELWWRTVFNEFATSRNDWKEYRDNLEKKLRDTSGLSFSEGDDVRRLRNFAGMQYQEADKLFSKLTGYAVRYAVPMEWRKY